MLYISILQSGTFECWLAQLQGGHIVHGILSSAKSVSWSDKYTQYLAEATGGCHLGRVVACLPGILSAIFRRSMPRIRFIFREWIFRMSNREDSLGLGNSILRSMRPGRSSAASKMSILLVAIRTCIGNACMLRVTVQQSCLHDTTTKPVQRRLRQADTPEGFVCNSISSPQA